MNGIENISRAILPYTEKSIETNLLVITEKQAKEFDLKPDQVIKGIFSDDGKTFEIFVDKDNKYINLNTAHDAINYSKYQIRIKRDGDLGAVKKNKDISAIHPNGLMELLTNVTYSKIASLKLFTSPLLLKKLLNFYAELEILDSNISNINAENVKKWVYDNGYIFSKIKQNNKKNFREKISQTLSQIFISETESSKDKKIYFEDINKILTYLNSNHYETLIKDKDDKQTTRVIIFFQNFSPVEVVFNKRKNPSQNHLNSSNEYPWNLVISTFVNSKSLMQIDISLIGAKKITLDINIPNHSLYLLAINSKSLLEKNFIKKDIDIGVLSIKNEKVQENKRSDLLSPSGNMNFVV